eukprot:jgi/Tetstr1/432664/TSEL_022032.t1
MSPLSCCMPSAVLVVEDTARDARFAHNPYVKGPPHIRFYAGTPLLSSDGTRYGTLSVLDTMPRTFTAGLLQLLANFGELAKQELERDEAKIESTVYGVALLDTRCIAWDVKYANSQFSDACGQAVGTFLGSTFWHSFTPSGKMTSQDMLSSARALGSFRVAVQCNLSGAELAMVLQPACLALPHSKRAVRIPGGRVSPESSMNLDMGEGQLRDAAICQAAQKGLFFAVVEQEQEHAAEKKMRPSDDSTRTYARSISSSSTSSATSGDLELPADLVDSLTLGPCIGSGSFGKVFRGTWQGNHPVAVKVVRCPSESHFIRAVEEGKLGRKLHHPSIVKTYRLSVEVAEMYSSKENGLDAVRLLWIVQEHCDRGTLLEAAERGWFCQRRYVRSSKDMPKLYCTLLEIAEGMAYMHASGIMHCDLNGRNIMLKYCPADGRKFVAKVADFGLARPVGDGYCRVQGVLGTVSHVPPEHIIEGRLTPAGDIWAFGVIMWECITGESAYIGKPMPLVMGAVSRVRRLDAPSASLAEDAGSSPAAPGPKMRRAGPG